MNLSNFSYKNMIGYIPENPSKYFIWDAVNYRSTAEQDNEKYPSPLEVSNWINDIFCHMVGVTFAIYISHW